MSIRPNTQQGDIFEEAFGFLVRDFGFTGPLVSRVAHETHYEYAKGETSVDLFTDSAPSPVLYIRAGGKQTTIWDFEAIFMQSAPAGRSYFEQLEAAAAFIQAHPNVLTGDFSELNRRAAKARRKPG